VVIAVHSVNVIVRQLERNINQYAGEETATSQEDVERVNPFDFFLYLCVVSMNDTKSYTRSNPLEP
jgi:cob(I)alamin adenosyltransferase